MPLSPPQRESLREAFRSAFTWETLQVAFRDHLNERLDMVSANGPFPDVVERVLDWGDNNGWERPLVRMVHESRPTNDKVIAFMDQHQEFPPLLLPEERERLRAGFFGVLKTVGELRALLQPELAGLPMTLLVNAADVSSANLYLKTLIVRADHFDFVLAFIQRALERFPSNAILETQARPLLDAIRGRRPAVGAARHVATDPFDACDLDGMLMIDREPLRMALRKISAGANPRVVGVGGASRSGKTHSKYLVLHVQEKAQKYEAVVIDLAEDTATATFGPEDLVRRIVRKWGRNDLVGQIPQRDSSEAEARWVIDLADFLVGEVRKSQRMLVLVLDGFGRDTVHRQTRELVGKLVRLAVTETYLRLILLHYPDELLAGEPPGRIQTHQLSLLSERDVRAFVSAYGLHRNDPPPESALNAVVDRVFADPVPVSNEEIARRVGEFLQELGSP